MIADAAELMYLAGRMEEAVALYERALALAPEGLQARGFGPYFMIQQAVAQRNVGNEERAQAAAQVARQETAAGRTAEYQGSFHHMAEAMLAAFDKNTDGAIDALKSAVQHGLRWLQFLDDPVFEDLQDDARFIAVRQEMEAIVAEEHEKILQLICFNNPVPDEWQPMPETCEGVQEQDAP
jgi:maltooligosyltrehalose synthase